MTPVCDNDEGEDVSLYGELVNAESVEWNGRFKGLEVTSDETE